MGYRQEGSRKIPSGREGGDVLCSLAAGSWKGSATVRTLSAYMCLLVVCLPRKACCDRSESWDNLSLMPHMLTVAAVSLCV